ncbi:hypothetical protein BEH94_04725 [Candidatus Altiarchaeales archaeon WOR_SM1_SCG]|nr:hypothetical protein BEH94_04725 [Candidatus Altiarchaeales archaeon WOR_SM1_SCG]
MHEKPGRTTTRDIMNTNVVSVNENENLENIANIMSEKEIGSVIVVNESGEAKGIITERDMIRIIARSGRGFFNLSAEEVMSKPLVTIIPSTDIEKIEKEMRKRNVKYLPVVESGMLVGIVTLKDVINYLEYRINYLTFK